MSTKPLAVLIDFNNLLYRMYHTQPPREYDGNRIESMQASVNSVLGFFDGKSGLTTKAEKVVVVGDHNGPTFRHELSPHYKAERKGMPENLKVQEDPACELVRSMGIPMIRKAGVEADDTLGMVAEHLASKGYKVIISTTDKDMHQLVNDDILLFNPVSQKLIDTNAVIKKFYVGPDKIAELLAIMGDKEDGIHGVPDVGLKTAAKWLNDYGDIDNLLANKNEVKGRGAKSLKETDVDLKLNLKLATIVKDPGQLTEHEISSIDSPEKDAVSFKNIEVLYGVKLRPYKGFSFDSESKEAAPEPEPKADASSQISLF